MEHEFGLSLMLPITAKQAEQLVIGKQRMTFRKIDPFSSEVIETGIGCTVCHKSGAVALTNPKCPGSPIVEEVSTPEDIVEPSDG